MAEVQVTSLIPQIEGCQSGNARPIESMTQERLIECLKGDCFVENKVAFFKCLKGQDVRDEHAIALLTELDEGYRHYMEEVLMMMSDKALQDIINASNPPSEMAQKKAGQVYFDRIQARKEAAQKKQKN